VLIPKFFIVFLPIFLMGIMIFGVTRHMRAQKVIKENKELLLRYKQEEDFRRAVKKGFEEKAGLWGRGPREELENE
jgi:hypothetical protein